MKFLVALLLAILTQNVGAESFPAGILNNALSRITGAYEGYARIGCSDHFKKCVSNVWDGKQFVEVQGAAFDDMFDFQSFWTFATVDLLKRPQPAKQNLPGQWVEAIVSVECRINSQTGAATW